MTAARYSQPSDIKSGDDGIPRHSASCGIFSIDAGRPFADDLAHGILDRVSAPEELARWRIYLPSKRACRALQAAFLNASSGKPLLLPQMRALGDVDELSSEWLEAEFAAGTEPLAPALNQTERMFILAGLIAKMTIGGVRISQSQALVMAEELAGLMDQMQQAGCSAEGLSEIIPEEFSVHWQDFSQFLNIIFTHWPDIVSQRSALDPVQRQLMLMDRQMAIWSQTPPDSPVLIAGSTGSLPKTAQMMQSVLSLPRGMVVLPGLFRGLNNDEDCEAVRGDIGHPQHQILTTLDRLGLTPQQVMPWRCTQPAGSDTGQSDSRGQAQEMRRQLMVETFRPHQQTDIWRRLDKRDIRISAEAVRGLSVIEAADTHHEADIIAGLLRKALEVPEKTAMLVTPDRKLARGVRASLLRWGLDIEDSAGVSLPQTARGEYLLLLAEWAERAGDAKSLLSLGKNRFASGGTAPHLFRNHLAAIEHQMLRGVISASDYASIADRLEASETTAALSRFYHDHILAPLTPLTERFQRPAVSLAEMAEAHGQAAEALAQTDIDNQGLIELWSGVDGEAASALLTEIARFGKHILIRPDEYRRLFATLAERTVVRTPWRSHPRLAILGTVEARMQSADLVIMGGVNDGSWPPSEQASPWINQQIREALGLPDRRWRTGLAAHDFFMLASAPEVVITRALRADDSPTTKSRWLERLDAVLSATRLSDVLERDIPPDLQAGLDSLAPDVPHPCDMPAPKPPVSVRPRRFSVTEFDKWITDPYQIYAKHILKLAPLEEVDKQPDAALRGSIYHDAIAHFLTLAPSGLLDDDASSVLAQAADAEFSAFDNRPQIRYFWRPRFDNIADWFLSLETERRADIIQILSEKKGHMICKAPHGDIIIRAKADRLDKLKAGTWEIIDYKTGYPPTKAQVSSGRATQLILEALILRRGGFEGQGAGPHEISSLSYWHLTGKARRPATRHDVTPDEFDPDLYEDRLSQLLARFDSPDQPYLPEPDPQVKPAFSPYRHLARIREWRPFEVDDD